MLTNVHFRQPGPWIPHFEITQLLKKEYCLSRLQIIIRDIFSWAS
jgi:hypothetical protein